MIWTLSMRSRLAVNASSCIRHFRRTISASNSSGVASQKVEVNGVKLHCEITGKGDHKLLLLPGALGSSKTDFLQQLTHYNKEDFTLIAIDPRGYGKSRPPDRDWPLEFFQRDADDAMELVKKLSLDRVSILGWSDGGITGLVAAARYPDLVNKLIVWGSNAFLTEQDINLYNNIRDISKWSKGMRTPFLEVYGETYFKEHWNNWIDAIQSYFDKKNGDICTEDLKNITAPTLVIHGQKDPLVPVEHAEFIHKNVKNSRLHIMPEGKHNLHIRYYADFNLLTEEFLSKLLYE